MLMAWRRHQKEIESWRRQVVVQAMATELRALRSAWDCQTRTEILNQCPLQRVLQDAEEFTMPNRGEGPQQMQVQKLSKGGFTPQDEVKQRALTV